MAAPKQEEPISQLESKDNEIETKKQDEDISIPKVDPNVIKKLNQTMQQSYKHKAKYNINDNGSVTFYPTPDCKPAKTAKHKAKISMSTIMNDANCTKAEAYSNPNDT
eukprot:134965_1